MFIVRVIPIARNIFKDELSFFSREEIPEGMLVYAPVRGKELPSLVISSTDAREEKSEIRQADFSLKKINPDRMARVLSKAFVESIRDTAAWHGSHESQIMSLLTSHVILNTALRLSFSAAKKETEDTEVRPRSEVLILQAEREERLRTYRNLAREGFARGTSLLVIVPTVIEGERLKKELERGIEERVILIDGDMPAKKLIEAWKRCIESTKPILAIGTAFALSLPRVDIDTVILERESARAYRAIARPRADIRRAAEFFCRRQGARCILADFPVRVETRYRLDIGEAEELSRPQARSGGAGRVEVIDVRGKEVPGKDKSAKRQFRALSPEVMEKIRIETARGGRVAVFAARKGISPLTVCNDCGTPVTDPDTGVPMVLHKSAEGNVFLSHRSGALIPAGVSCRHCGSWNLVSLGIGIERVYDELNKAFPETPVHLFTKDTAPTHTSAKKIAERFYGEKSTIVAGTERMLPYLYEPVEMSVVASVDSLLSLPVWRAHEYALATLFYLREIADLASLVETRKPDHLVMRTLLGGNPYDFYRVDIAEREKYQYPPFSVFVGLSWKGNRQAVEKNREMVAAAFEDVDLVGPLPAITESKNEWSARAVIRLKKGSWPDHALGARLRTLPPDIAVTIDPDEIA
ncbi:MAG: hypothetical protein JO026_00490 [Patescibacteria group bacterium]|nr:hypothetical protein [Patescibacteria group bacterium]